MARIYSESEDSVPCRKITFPQPEDSSKKERPRLKWLDSVLKDLKTLKVNAWWKKAWDRDLWSEIIKEAKTHKGLQRRRKGRLRAVAYTWPATIK
jgi:hypothetical protein